MVVTPIIIKSDPVFDKVEIWLNKIQSKQRLTQIFILNS